MRISKRRFACCVSVNRSETTVEKDLDSRLRSSIIRSIESLTMIESSSESASPGTSMIATTCDHSSL